MNQYIDRLIACGVPVGQACSTYIDFVTNFSLVELDIYVQYKESMHDVD